MANDPNWPVLIYVAAWLLPLASFILLVLGGRKWGRAGAFIALAAIFGSFVLSTYGLIRYVNDFTPSFFPETNTHESPEHESHAAVPSLPIPSDRAAQRPTSASNFRLVSYIGPTASDFAIDPLTGVNPEADPGVGQDGAGVVGAPQQQKKQQDEPQQMIPMPAPGPTGGGGVPRGPGVATGPAPPPPPPVIKLEPGVWKVKFNWITIGTQKSDQQIPLGFYVDSLTVIMFFMVTMVATLIHLFSMEYMHEELHDPVHDPLAVEPGQPPLHRQGRYPRFFTYLSLFCFSMLGLVLADNAFMVFMFWEAVGLCSYLLIGFYYERKSASTAANKAFITNRVGDAGFIVGLMILWTTVGSFNIQDVSRAVRNGSGDMVRLDKATSKPLIWDVERSVWVSQRGEDVSAATYEPGDVQLFREAVPRRSLPHGLPGTVSYAILTLAGVGIFIGCVGKSAQFPLHVWLPDAMEGPTPVSALIHAATMVAAGVYFVGRFYAIFTPHALLVIAYTGGITLFLAGTIALVMTDIKKVLAYSTVSQLGYMMLGLGVGGWAAGLFHLLTHAFFKALLFLGSGSVIHGTGTQEMPQMGGLWRKMPKTAVTMFIGVLAICGIPYFSGYYSKDSIVAQALYFWQGAGTAQSPGHSQHILLFLLPAGGAAITAFYMFRLFFMTFAGEPRDHHVAEHAHESKWVMWVPLAVLSVPSVIVGYGWNGKTPLLERILMFRPPFVGHLDHVPHAIHEFAGEIALGAVLFGIGMSILFYGDSVFGLGFLKYLRVLDPAEVARQFPGIHDFLSHKWYFDELYDAVLIRPTLTVASFCRAFDWNVLDRFIDGLAQLTVWWSRMDGWFDFRLVDGAVNGVSDLVYATGNRLRKLQTGQLRQYVMFLAVAAVGLFAIISFLGADVLKALIVK
jgi:NADH:ubiquinone oxidoreductase subunit 5 (subunit L)/multisubunit Na+/H+ antiporter MnhA subunit